MNSMALFWAMAEIWILLYLIRVAALTSGKPVVVGRYRMLFMASGTLLAILAFGGTTIASHMALFQTPMTFHLYRCAQWHFFCALWVILEGLLMIYILRFYVLLKRTLADGREEVFRSRRLVFLSRLAAVALVISFLGFFYIYEYQTWQLTHASPLTYIQVNRISTFFINICGFFWVIFDGGLALLGYLTYQLFSRQAHPKDGIYHGSTAAVG